jgi:hypothetical protein
MYHLYNVHKLYKTMGGEVFDDTKIMTKDEYDQWMVKFLAKIGLVECIDFVFPYRLKNKMTYSDVDFIAYDCDKFVDTVTTNDPPKSIKKILLSDEKIDSYSMHMLTNENIQIDVLKSWSDKSIEMTRIFYSYSCANIFFKKLLLALEGCFRLSHMGLLCADNTYTFPDDVHCEKIGPTTRLITDHKFFFGLLDLSYERFIGGFNDEYELLDYFKTSKYFDKIKFIVNSKFRHDCKRLAPFNNLYVKSLLNI